MVRQAAKQDFQARSAEIDLAAIRANISHFRQRVAPAQLLCVVKADGYGHGALPVALAALDAGADFLGTAHLSEALALRQAGIEAPLLAWLHTPGTDFAAGIQHRIALGVSSLWELNEITAAAAGLDTRAVVHLKVDTGLHRNGCLLEDLTELAAAARAAEQAGLVQVDGVFSHLACAEEDDQQPTHYQREQFQRAETILNEVGLQPRYRHLANSAGAWLAAENRYEMVRVGIGSYGMNPFPATSSHGTELQRVLRPGMRLRTQVAGIKKAHPGGGVSYGWRYHTGQADTLALIPLGYADGLPRSAQGATVEICGREYPIVGTIAMDQCLALIGQQGHEVDPHITIGSEVTVFGGPQGPSATDWAHAAGTIDYEILTRVSPRVPRRYYHFRCRISSPGAAQTTAFAQGLAELLGPGDGVVLSGELGAGKTTFTQGLARGLGVQEQITSPTFVIARHHENTAGPDLVHVDAYRLSGVDELSSLDLDSVIPHSVTVVEWGEGYAEELFTDWVQLSISRDSGHNSTQPLVDFSDEPADEPRQLEFSLHQQAGCSLEFIRKFSHIVQESGCTFSR